MAEGWESAWQRFHRPVVIGDLWLGPPWETSPPGLRAVTIRPGMAFGTGAHPTSQLCIELLLAEPRGALVDLGCGSGVLSIVAAAEGFSPVVAIDSDPVALTETCENARRNDVALELVDADIEHHDAAELRSLVQGTTTCDPVSPVPGCGPRGLAVANLPEPVLVAGLRALSPRRAIVSGFPAGQVPHVPGYQLKTSVERGVWGAAILDQASSRAAAGNYP